MAALPKQTRSYQRRQSRLPGTQGAQARLPRGAEPAGRHHRCPKKLDAVPM